MNLPNEVVNAAQTLTEFFAQQGILGWELMGVRSRSEAPYPARVFANDGNRWVEVPPMPTPPLTYQRIEVGPRLSTFDPNLDYQTRPGLLERLNQERAAMGIQMAVSPHPLDYSIPMTEQPNPHYTTNPDPTPF